MGALSLLPPSGEGFSRLNPPGKALPFYSAISFCKLYMKSDYENCVLAPGLTGLG